MKESEKLLLNLDQFAILKSKYLQGMRKCKAYIKGGQLLDIELPNTCNN
jgi:hypothetical protein